MAKRLFFDDVHEGMPLPPVVRETSVMQLVEYAGASRDFYIIHHDRDYARSIGLPDIIIQGSLKSAFLGQLVTGWMGEWGTLKSLEVQYRGIDVPGQPLTAKGTVTRAYMEGGEGHLDCDIWLENADGERTTRGRATVVLPSRRPAENGGG